VIKLVWGSDWDGLFARDLTGALLRALRARRWTASCRPSPPRTARFNRDNFFGQNAELAALAPGHDRRADRPPQARRPRPGEDPRRLCAAPRAPGQPTVILAQTKKGYGMGTAGQGRMTTHSQKKLDDDDLIEFRNRFNLPLTDAQATGLSFFKPADDSPEMRYLHERRARWAATCRAP
jgi:pyruvate dehydrogenase E1 component